MLSRKNIGNMNFFQVLGSIITCKTCTRSQRDENLSENRIKIPEKLAKILSKIFMEGELRQSADHLICLRKRMFIPTFLQFSLFRSLCTFVELPCSWSQGSRWYYFCIFWLYSRPGRRSSHWIFVSLNLLLNNLGIKYLSDEMNLLCRTILSPR